MPQHRLWHFAISMFFFATRVAFLGCIRVFFVDGVVVYCNKLQVVLAQNQQNIC